MSALSLQQLSYAYSDHNVVDNLSLELHPGEFLALLGPNGAGKSTLFNLITGLLVQRTGRVQVSGIDLQEDRLNALKKVGAVFQQTTLDLDLTPLQNLRYFAGLQGLKPSKSSLDLQLEKFGLQAFSSMPVRKLSGGFKRRLEIARALLHQPQILILDEPTSGLDLESRESIVRHVHELAEQGVAVLWITHLLDELRDDDRVAVINKGQIRREGRVGELGGAAGLSQFLRRSSEELTS